MGQEMIESFHRWSVILGTAGICGSVLLAVLFWRFRYGGKVSGWIRDRRKRRRRFRDGTAILLAAALLIPSAGALAAEASELPDPPEETAGKVSVAVLGTSVRPDVYQDTAVAEVTFREKNFDKNGICMIIGDETGRETRLTLEEDGWAGLSGLGEGALEVIPYETADAGSEAPEETPQPGEDADRWFLDSEEGASEHTEERTVKMRLRFPEEGRFEIREITCRDLAGNVSGLPEPVSVTIDRTPPVLEIHIPEEELAHEGYYSHPVTVWLYLKEHNFKPDEEEGFPQIFLEAGKEEGGEEIRAERAEGTEGCWETASEKGADWYKLPVSVTEDGNYRLNVSYEDPAGWSLSAESRTEAEFTVDVTAPEFGSITAMGESWNAFFEHITFGRYSSDKEPVILTGGDSVSPVEPLRYLCADRELTERELEEIEEGQWKEGDSLVLEPDIRTVVYLKVTNYSGLSSYFNSSGLVIEDKGPVITLSPQGEAWAGSGIYRGNVELTAVLKEPEETGVVSGLKHASYVLEAERGGKRELLEEGILLDGSTETGAAEGPLKSWQDRRLLPADRYDGETLWFTVSAEDLAGNRSEKSICLAIDRTAPVLQIIYGNEQPKNDRYYDRERSVLLTIEEVNFSEERVWISVTNTDRILPEISGWSHRGNLHSCRIVFSEDGDYTFSVRCEDLAGHASERTEKDFTIDRTPPKVSVEFSEEGRTGGGRYYNTPGTVEITVEEHNFDREQVAEELTALLDDGRMRSWKAEDFDSRGDTHTASLPFSEDGDYRFLLACADRAGNKSGEAAAEFSVDRTPPSIEILGLEPDSANRGEVGAEVRLADKRLIPETAAVEVARLDQEGEKRRYRYQELSGGGGEIVKKLLPESFPETEEADGLYVLRAAGEDRAGNRTERELLFSVNRYGSVFAVAGETGEWLGAETYPYLPEEREVVIREYNVDPVEDFQVSLSRNGAVGLLSEGKGFQRKALSEGAATAGWKVYEYRIRKEVFEQEGDYELLFHSMDRAGNRTGNGSARNEERKKVFAFSVDKTGPSAVLSGAEDRGRYRADSLEVFLDIRDNMRLQKVEVRAGDKKSLYEGENLRQILSEGEFKVELSETDDWQTLELYAEDAAGNRLELGNGRRTGAPGCLEWDFLITSDWWIQLYKSPGRLVLLLFFAGGAFAAAGFAGIRLRRAKKKMKGLQP